MNESRKDRLVRLAWLALLCPGLLHLTLLMVAMMGRLSYPYDLEWMEGGLLNHAQRIADGQGIYTEPSIDFIPYLYTPLYPGFLALLSGLFGVSYTVGRVISVLSTLGVIAFVAFAIVRDTSRDERRPAVAGAALAGGLFAATYPWVEGWYDIVRADSLFLLMIVGGLLGVRMWARAPGQSGIFKLASAAAVLGLSFFCKQTGVLFVAAGGVLLLALNWRRVPLYVAVTGVIGLGGTWLLNRTTGGWFWTYVYEVHQAHDFNPDRFYKSFGNILWHFPAMTLLIVAALAAVVSTWVLTRTRPASSHALLVWTPIFVVSVVVGAIGWGTEFAHFNAYIPAMTTGALCAGAAIPALVGSARTLWPEGHAARALSIGLVAAATLGAQLLMVLWSPGQFIPTSEDRERGDALVAHIHSVEGEVLIPYHPWYAKLAGKRVYTHFMGLRDVSTGKSWPIRGREEAIREHRFAEVILDNRPIQRELSLLRRYYRMDDILPAKERPRVYTGAGAVWRKSRKLVPESVWVPAKPLEVPDGARALWDFEDGSLQGWKQRGRAWGARPVSRALPKQGPVRRYGGRYYVSSFHGGDDAVGTLTSPRFRLDGSQLSFRLSGGDDGETLRAELVIDGEVVKTATGTNSERMEDIRWSIAAWSGATARIVLTDESRGSWGHLNADEFWIWE